MASLNQTGSHCVNQMEKTHSKPLAAQHGRGTAWAQHAVCASAFTVTVIIMIMNSIIRAIIRQYNMSSFKPEVFTTLWSTSQQNYIIFKVVNSISHKTCCLHIQDKGKDASNRLFCIVFICPQRPQPESTYFTLMLQTESCIVKHSFIENLHIFTSTTIFHLYKDYLFSSDLTEIRTQGVK